MSVFNPTPFSQFINNTPGADHLNLLHHKNTVISLQNFSKHAKFTQLEWAFRDGMFVLVLICVTPPTATVGRKQFVLHPWKRQMNCPEIGDSTRQKQTVRIYFWEHSLLLSIIVQVYCWYTFTLQKNISMCILQSFRALNCNLSRKLKS